ncbi:MAG: hypothetical protein IPO40_18700 [Fibrobacteres bacterium]|nr:hypothetical protein [Fibrobacterota bacterium]
MKYAPTEGYVPRGFYGGSGQLSEIELVLILAEPGDPKPGEATTDIETALACAGDYYRSAKSIGHKNVMNILTRCFPGQSFDEIFRNTWITESVLCSAAVTTGKVPREVEAECYHRFLGQQLDMLPNAMVATFGTKAFQRVRRFTKRDIIPCGAVFPPGCNQSQVIRSWNTLVAAFHAKSRL